MTLLLCVQMGKDSEDWLNIQLFIWIVSEFFSLIHCLYLVWRLVVFCYTKYFCHRNRWQLSVKAPPCFLHKFRLLCKKSWNIIKIYLQCWKITLFSVKKVRAWDNWHTRRFRPIYIDTEPCFNSKKKNVLSLPQKSREKVYKMKVVYSIIFKIASHFRKNYW